MAYRVDSGSGRNPIGYPCLVAAGVASVNAIVGLAMEKVLTSNQFWGGLNRRFDRRIGRLYRLGYRLESTDHGPVMAKRRYCEIRCVPNCMILHCCNRDYYRFLRGVVGPSGARKVAP